MRPGATPVPVRISWGARSEAGQAHGLYGVLSLLPFCICIVDARVGLHMEALGSSWGVYAVTLNYDNIK